jgi:peptidoglycan LD-endopeptidase CwlK
MPFELTTRDLEILSTVHPDLQRVIERAAELAPFRFRILEGIRTLDRQKELVDRGASRTMNSRHLTGHAVDLAPYFDGNGDGKVDGGDMWHWPLYHQLAPIIKEAAKQEGVQIEWGGDWRSFKDGPHWQLPWSAYPANEPVVAPRATAPVDRPGTHAVAVSGSAAAAVTTVAAPVIPEVIDTLTSQQDNLTSGDFARIAFALVILALAVVAIKTR